MKKYIRRFMFDKKTNFMLVKEMIKGIFTLNPARYNQAKFFLGIHLNHDYKKVWSDEAQDYVFTPIDDEENEKIVELFKKNL